MLELVAYTTVTSSAGAASNDTVKVAVPSDSLTVTLAISTPGSSSSLITRSAVSFTNVPLDGLLNVSVAVSFGSSEISTVMGTVITPVVCPPVMVKVPVVPV